MLVIRKEQMNVMSAYMFDKFISKMVVQLRATHSDKTQNKNDESIREFVRASIERANSFGIRTTENLEIFLEYTIEHGLDFYKKPDYAWANSILIDNSIEETEKMNLMNEQQIFGDWSSVG